MANKTLRSIQFPGLPDTYTIASGATAQVVTIAVADWAGGTTCTKSVTSVTTNSIVIVDTSDGNVECTGQGAGTLTFTAMSAPTSAVTAKVVIL